MIEWGENAEEIECNLRLANLIWYALNACNFKRWE